MLASFGSGSSSHTLQQQKRLQEFLAHERPPLAHPPTHVTNDVSDIHGAKPLLKSHVYVNKPHYHEPQDIFGSASKELHPKNRRVGADDRFKQLPIEGSSTSPAGFKTNRVCNPLIPDYKLPSFKEAPPVVPKFLRDSYIVTDIDGTSFKKKEIANPRSPMRLDDIAGAQAGWLPFNKRGLRENPPRDIINVSDITNVEFKSSRVTNVLNPVYTVNGMTYQDDELSRPKPLHVSRNKPYYALQTSDISGANAFDASKNVVGGIPNDKRRGFRTTNNTSDITGAQADTFQHSIRSQRRVDPNWPEYNVLDGKKVDSSAMSVAKSIVFADLIRDHDVVWTQDDFKAPHVVCGIANIGMTGGAHKDKDKNKDKDKDKPPRRSTAPAVVLHDGGNTSANHTSRTSSRTLTTAGTAAANSAASTATRVTPTDKRQADARRQEIQLVRELQ